jgi:diguanylate cyclase (GGDEF)-like protein
MATTDPMTNINNRRNFFTLGNEAFKKAVENKTELIAVMFDIDKFKNVNDTYGHAIGDEVIKDMANAVKKFIDEGDIFGRLGGEEFALLVAERSMEFVEEKAQKIRQYIQDLNPTYGDVSLSFTVSTGITDIDYDNDELDLMLARADEELYNAKNDGRNCVKSFRVKS